jgi:hypothetical protein
VRSGKHALGKRVLVGTREARALACALVSTRWLARAKRVRWGAVSKHSLGKRVGWHARSACVGAIGSTRWTCGLVGTRWARAIARAFSGFNEHPLVNIFSLKFFFKKKLVSNEPGTTYCAPPQLLTLKMFVMKEVLKKKTYVAIYLRIMKY